eukprot:Gb_21427 [translate_table: standard]
MHEGYHIFVTNLCLTERAQPLSFEELAELLLHEKQCIGGYISSNNSMALASQFKRKLQMNAPKQTPHLLTAQMNLKASLRRISCALFVIRKVTLKRVVGRRKQIKRKRLKLLLYLLMTRKPSVSNLQVFGCTTFVHVPDKKRQKLDDKSHKCILVRYSESSKAYRLWDPSQRKIAISRDVLFDESNEGIVPIVNADAKGKEVKDETDE